MAKVFEQLPKISEAFREGKLCWSKARALKRITTPENEAEMLEFALRSKAQAVERAVALTPSQHKRGQALKASLEARQSQPELNLAEMSRALLASADNRSKVRHQVIVHVNGATGEGFYDTDRGLLPAEPEAVDEAMKQTGIVVAAAPNDRPAGSTQAEPLPLLPSQSKGRPGLPVGLARAVYARALGCCERCSCKSGNLVVHHVRAWSDTRQHRLEDLELLCPSCHAVEHEKDFANRPERRGARDASVRRRRKRARSG